MTSYECEKVHSAFVGELLIFAVDFRANIVLFLYDVLLCAALHSLENLRAM